MSSKYTSLSHAPSEGDEAVAVPVGGVSHAPSAGDAVAVPVGGDFDSTNPPGFWDNALGPQKGRENHLFFGCCCDVRRAVLIVNIITICSNLLLTFFVFIGAQLVEGNPSAYTDQMQADVSDEDLKTEMTVLEIVTVVVVGVSCILHAFGVSGALKYNSTHVKVAAVSYGIALVLNLFNFNLVSIAVGAIFLYPHIVLIKEIKSGVMTPYNYENIQACCVC
eukprot:scaffold4961_cov80-Cylindrotheca_fusiformis.AAC.2